MAKKQLTISIPSPCTAHWHNMTPDKNGKFCASCQKTVVDFSRMSDAEIIHYFETFQGATCGRFSEKQLSAPIVENFVAKPQNRWAWALSALLLPTLAAAQTTKMPQPTEISAPSVFKEKMMGKDLPITGEVAELGSHLPLENIYVSILSNGNLVAKAVTDAKGFFSIKLPVEFGNQSFTLYFDGRSREKQMLTFSDYAAMTESHLFVKMEQNRRLRGVVTDEQNQPFIGVTIVLKGTTIGVLTDMDGRFDLKFPSKEMDNQPIEIVVSYVGYEHQNLVITNSTNDDVKIIMKENMMVLGDIVVVVRYNFFQRTKYRIKNFFRKMRRD
jgi:CarboxypepD_reg-like domain